MTTPLRIQLLGPVRAWRGDDEIALGSARRRAVFAMLALRVNETVSYPELVDGLWGQRPPTRAVGVLHTYAHDLRRALEPARDVLVTVEASYSLRVPPDQVDEHRFRELHESARRHLARGNLTAALDSLDAALALWHGDALHGLSGPYVELHRARLNESRVTAMEQRSALRLLLGDHTGATATLSELITAFPLRETTCGLLMVALYLDGRRDEALGLYRDTERNLIDEQGIEPGPALRGLHQRIVDEQPVSADDIGFGMPRPAQGVRASHVLPAAPEILVGRDQDAAALRALLPSLLAGQGGCRWLEGEPGIGKTSLITAAFAQHDTGGLVMWTPGDRLVPDAKDVAVLGPAAVLAAVDRAVRQVEQLCVQQPVVFVVDDAQLMDEAGMLAWQRLSRLTQRLPLLLLGVCQTAPAATALKQVRGAVTAVGGQVTAVRPIGDDQVALLAEQVLGEPCGPALLDALATAAGNPADIHQLLDAVRGPGEPMAAARTRLALRRIGLLTPQTRNLLGWAALLDDEIGLGGLAAVMRTSVADLTVAIHEATVARVLREDVSGLAFRDEFTRQTLLDEQPPSVRAAMHRDAAAALAGAGAQAALIADQLLLGAPLDAFGVRWLVDNVDAVEARSPSAAMDLLELAVAAPGLAGQHQEALEVRLVRLAFRLGRHPEKEARSVLDSTTDPEHAGQMRWILAHLDHRAGAVGKAVADLREAAADALVPAFWRARYQILLAEFEREVPDDLADAVRTAGTALRHTTAADAVTTADALTELWYVETGRRNHAAALSYVDKAIEVIGAARWLSRRHLHLLGCRAFTMQNLDRLDEASETLATMGSIADRMRPPAGHPHVVRAVHYYWLGKWDKALAEVTRVDEDDDPDWSHDLVPHASPWRHGVAALIAAHRGDSASLRTHLRAAETYPLITAGEQDTSDFLLVARAVEAGGRAGPHAELSTMDPLLDLKYGRVVLRHQWLPRITRLALAAGDHARVQAAARVSEIESERETPPARAHAAARWCRAIVAGDADELLATSGHFRTVGRPVEMAMALVDAAVALAERRRTDLARRTFRDALSVLTELAATADLNWASARMRGFGIEETAPPAISSRHALSDTERRIAELVADGKSNLEIATELALSRREVQSLRSRHGRG